ncbi:MAG: hypothetical protein IT198_10365 [Acidimicrobiia bacterium]|nr:hypothetical protein [Acidimicrobiia bacterium]
MRTRLLTLAAAVLTCTVFMPPVGAYAEEARDVEVRDVEVNVFAEGHDLFVTVDGEVPFDTMLEITEAVQQGKKRGDCFGHGIKYFFKCVANKLKSIPCRPTGPTPITPNDPYGISCSWQY